MNIDTCELIALKKDILKRSHILRFKVKGKSMHPLIKDGSIIRARSIDARRINCADIILYQNAQNRLIVHRVIKKRISNGMSYFLVRGDSSWQADDPVYPDKILGKVVIIEKNKQSVLNLEKGTFKILHLFYAKMLFLKRWLSYLQRVNFKFKKNNRLQPENLLIEYLCLPKAGEEEIKDLSSQDLDWDYFLTKVCSEGISSLAYDGIKKITGYRQILPETIKKKLESAYYTIAARNVFLSVKLKEILCRFKETGIEVLLLKGMALIHSVYHDLCLRPMYDIDILIRKHDFEPAKTELEKIGYAGSAAYPENFYKEGVRLDLHLEFLNTYRVRARKKSSRIDLEKIWRNSQSIKIEGVEARILSPEDMLFQLCLHLAFHHGFSGLMWYFDIINFLQAHKEKLDWIKFIRDSREYEINKPLYYILCSVNKILKEAVSEDVLEKLKPKNQGLLEKRVAKMIFSEQYSKNFRFLFTLAMLDSLGSRILFLKNVFFPPLETLKPRYGDSSILSCPKCYLLHFYQVFLSGLDGLKKTLLSI